MKKLGLLLCATSALLLAACSASAAQIADLPERDARIIVEVDRNINKLSESGAKQTQAAVYENIKRSATANIRMIDNYTVLNNAFVLEVNSDDIESIKTVPGVKSVTVDKIHWERAINHDEYVPYSYGTGAATDESANISAETMKKPEDTNEGEGTLVAILDNEFHFRGKTGNPEDRSGGEAWNHEVYDALSDDVAVRYTFDSIKEIGGLKAGKRTDAQPGEEGSMYYNNKVPFYFDYGGTSKYYGKRGNKQYDVHSDLSYHGSHVSSITAANAPDYKGIAPKAQLALMKVFTDFDSKAGVGKKIGLSDSTGAYDTSILDALEDCIKLKVDGINMSLGSDLDDFDGDSITLKTLTRLNEEGILTSISAGNSGKTSYSSTGAYGNWMPESVETGIMSSYANNAASMTIASGHPTKIFYENAFVINNENIAFEDQIVNRYGFDDDYEVEVRMKDIYQGQSIGWVYIPGFGTTGDYSKLPIDPETGKMVDVKGKIAVVNRGSTSFADKYAAAVSKKAAGLVIINNDPTASSFNFRCSFGDGFDPTIPCALVLYKDKAFFQKNEFGTLDLINKQVSDNPNQYTVSNFSTDGATFDLDLKPEITAPGDNIKGAVPEHAITNLEDRVENACYEYLSGTSMSAPNYAGAQALVLSKAAAPIYQAAKAAGRALTADELKEIADYRATVNMRLMSTADPMHDVTFHPEQTTTINPDTLEEEGVKSLTSPRIQGAGMVDLDGALKTDVYLEGLDLAGNPIGKSKIALRYSEDIAKGDIKLSFLAHNESNEARNYDVTMTVLRPAIAHPNDIVTKEYNYKGTVEAIENFTGMKYYDKDLDRMVTVRGDVAFKDALQVGKDIEYYASKADYQADKKTTIKKGYYYNSATDGVSWDPLPSYIAQSTMDVEIAKITGQTVTVAPGTSTVTINPYSLPEAEKDKILEVYEYGCMIEGFVTLTSKDSNKADLSIPYLGFYAGADRDPEASYEKAPVVEPFNFEKDQTKVYPSDLVNDLAKSLVGKGKANMESMIVAGYAENPQKIDVDKVLTNDQAFDNMTGFYKVGTDPLTNEYMDNPSDNIYIGSEATNTMIIQQFVLRSVKENNFTITNKETGELVFASAMEDMLYSDTANHWALYKSHVDSGYLSAGYIAHRAYSIVPLYDEATGERFPSGEYELKFNYQLAATNGWVSKSYNLHIDTDCPVVKGIAQYKLEGVDRVRIYLEDTRLAYGVVGYNRVDIEYDEVKKQYYIDETKEFIDECIEELSEDTDGKRLFIRGVDYARGEVGAIVHLNDGKSFTNGYQIVQGAGITTPIDYKISADNKITFSNVYTGAHIAMDKNFKVTTYAANGSPVAKEIQPTLVNPGDLADDAPAANAAVAKKGCNGALASMTLMISIPALMGASLLFFRKRKEGGK